MDFLNRIVRGRRDKRRRLFDSSVATATACPEQGGFVASPHPESVIVEGGATVAGNVQRPEFAVSSASACLTPSDDLRQHWSVPANCWGCAIWPRPPLYIVATGALVHTRGARALTSTGLSCRGRC
jgi:hypothetical protein